MPMTADTLGYVKNTDGTAASAATLWSVRMQVLLRRGVDDHAGTDAAEE